GSKIIDMGCGKGVAIMAFADFPFTRIAGCDLSSELIHIAERNFARSGIKGVVLCCCDAAQFDGFDDYSHIYFYNPFSREIFARVMANVEASLTRKPREVTIIYRNPECHDAIVAGSVFRKTREFRYSHLPYYVYVNVPGQS